MDLLWTLILLASPFLSSSFPTGNSIPTVGGPNNHLTGSFSTTANSILASNMITGTPQTPLDIGTSATLSPKLEAAIEKFENAADGADKDENKSAAAIAALEELISVAFNEFFASLGSTNPGSMGSIGSSSGISKTMRGQTTVRT